MIKISLKVFITSENQADFNWEAAKIDTHYAQTGVFSEFFWSVFFRIRTEYKEMLRIFPYSVRIRENREYGKTPSAATFHAVSNCCIYGTQSITLKTKIENKNKMII